MSKHFTKTPIFFLPLIFYASITASAQQLIDGQLKEPIKQALASNYALKNKMLETEKTNSTVQQVKSKLLPDVSASGAYTYFANSGTVDLAQITLPIIGLPLFKGEQDFTMRGQFVNVGLTATQVLFTGLQIPNAVKALQEKSKAEGFLAEAERETIAKEVILTFDQIMLLEEVEKLIVDSEKRLNKENERVNKAIANGLAIPYDRDKIKLALLELTAKKLELKGTRQLLWQKSAMLTHLPLKDIHQINYQLQNIYLADTAASIANRKELMALKASSEALNYLLKKEKGGALPSLFAFGNVSSTNIFDTKTTFKGMANNHDFTLKMNRLSLFPNLIVGVGAKWAIFSGGEHKQKITQAKLDIEMNTNKRLEAEELLNLQLEKSKIDYQTAAQKMKVNEQQTVVSRNNIDLATRRYQEGLITITDRLAAENDYYLASVNFFSQVIEQRKTALTLLQHSGNLLTKLMN